MRKIGLALLRTILAMMAVVIVAAYPQTARAQASRPAETFPTAAGEVKITPIYHATAMIEGAGIVIYIDPAKPANFTGLPKADLILITHEHPDHVDQDLTSIKAISKDGTRIWTTENVAKFVPGVTIMYNGEVRKTAKNGWLIEAFPAYNVKRGPAPGQFYHPMGEGNGYILTLGGMRFYFSGDTEATPEMRALRNINVAFLCMNLPYTMSTTEATDAVKAFKPKVVIPYHYRGTTPEQMAAFRESFAGMNMEVRSFDWYPKQ